jgi:tetratricopeptide (TPR) repeat protein
MTNFEKFKEFMKQEDIDRALTCLDMENFYDVLDYLREFAMKDVAIFFPKIFDKIPEIFTRPDDAWCFRGNLASTLGHSAPTLEDAVDCYNKALEINPKNAVAWFNKGNALLRIALSYLPKANSIDSDEDKFVEPPEVVKEKYQEALLAFEKYVQIEPNDATAWREIAGCYTFLGKYEEALINIEKAIAIKQDDFTIWNVKWIDLYRLGRMEESDQVWKIMNELGKK